MSDKNAQLTKTVGVSPREDELRLFPFITAGVICFALAVVLGAGSWYLFGTRRFKPAEALTEANFPAAAAEVEKTAAATNADAPATTAPAGPDANGPAPKPALENLVEVAGGEVVTGGGDTKKPLERQFVSAFSIATTEVTNAEYAEFLKDTNRAAPAGWNKYSFPDGTDAFPVTNVSYADADAFCEWLAKKTGLPVRLPTEAEWELAARGREGYKYPWGNEWKAGALASKENGGKVAAVRSYPRNRSPFGAYDMAGNVWEWTRDRVDKNEAVTDEQVREALAKGQVLRIVKGGAATESAAQISSQARYEIPETTRVPTVGFRYLVERR